MSIEARFRLDFPAFRLEVDLDLPARGITALFGPSGSGKTTLLRAIAGLTQVPDARLVVDGELWQDRDILMPAHRRPVGFVFQDARLFPHLTVRGNLEYGLRRAASADFSGFAAMVELMSLGTLLERKPDGLSGGERQRVAIARALLAQPRLLLMDEPLAALDAARKEEILPYLEQLHATLRIPVLYVSHAADEVARLADTLVVLEAGRVRAAGPLAETLARIDLPALSVRLGEDAGVIIDAMVGERDAEWHLARIDFPGGPLWVRDKGLPIGQPVRVRILARDVSIALEKVEGTSILNMLPATVVAIADEPHPAQALVRLAVGETPILARITRRSIAALSLEPGKAVWVQIKAAALIG